MTDLQDLLRAAAIAARKHRLQKRKDAEASPAINHPIEVAAILAIDSDVTDPVTLVAAVLHDTLEDTTTTPEELATAFSPTIRDLVQELTDNKRLPKPERKARQVAGAPHLSARAQLIRIAEKIANVQVVTPPSAGLLGPRPPAGVPRLDGTSGRRLPGGQSLARYGLRARPPGRPRSAGLAATPFVGWLMQKLSERLMPPGVNRS